MAVVIAYVIVLQAVIGGYARAATMTNAAQDPFHVICAAYGTTTTSTDKNDDPLRKSIDCPCATLCRLAGSSTPALVESFTFVIDTADTIGDPVAPADQSVAPSQQRRLLAEPRAPPEIS